EWPLNYPRDMVQKLGSTYGSYVSKVTKINNVHLIVASLKDRKSQCIVATASTTTLCDEVNRIVKEGANSSVVKFTRPKVFYEYFCSKGAVNINNQSCIANFNRGIHRGNISQKYTLLKTPIKLKSQLL
ncbi:14261_t:CDS:2, partial [Racocetra fulgida]